LFACYDFAFLLDNQACYPAEDEYERMREVLRIEQENKACANKAKQN
jgi:hypothetical protein